MSEARAHGLDDREAKRLEQCRLHEGAALVGDESIELPDFGLVGLHFHPADAAFEPALVEQPVRALDLLALVAVVGLFDPEPAADDE